ncbi:MAG TPA: hypothetical protein VK212_01015 [Lentimicrobium sp.]|nr:hypothetical protein [Lentimicrobium sp.]
MTKEEESYYSAGRSINGATESQMFGKPCFKVNGKAFVSFFQNEMVFKLPAPYHGEALKLQDARLFDPSGKSRPMKEWVQIPGKYSEQWPEFAFAAFEYVKNSK